MRRRVAARVALCSALTLLLASVVVCPARCLAGTVPPQVAPSPCHHAAGSEPVRDAGGLPPTAPHASCCVAALSSPTAPPTAPAPTLATLLAVARPLAAAWAPPVADACIDARGAPPTPLHLRLRVLLV